MKELYLDAEMDVVNFSVEDVITTSSSSVTTAPTSGNGGMGGPNEGEYGDMWS